MRAEVFARDGYRCRLEGVKGAGPCFGVLTFHHRRKSGQGGQYTVANGAALCAGHNERLESDARLAQLAKAMVPPLVLDRFGARVEVFWSQVDKHGPVNSWRPELGPCWLWTAGFHDTGYGAFHDTEHKAMYAHRFSLSLLEPLRKGREVDHLCRTRACVRPDHLEQVTPAVNRQRQGHAAKVLVTKCKRGHRFTEANTGWQRNGTRFCLKCQRARSAAHRLREKENRDAAGLLRRSESTPRQGATRKAPSSTAPRATPPSRAPARHSARARAR